MALNAKVSRRVEKAPSAELRAYREELRALEIEIASMDEKTRRRDALRKIVAGLEEYEGVARDFHVIHGGRESTRDKKPDGEPPLRDQVLAIVEDLGARRAVSKKKVVEEARARGVKTDAAIYDDGIQYVLTALLGQKKIKSKKRGFYRPNQKNEEAQG